MDNVIIVKPNIFVGFTSWHGICGLSRRLTGKFGTVIRHFQGIPGISGYRLFPDIKLDLVYIRSELSNSRSGTIVSGNPDHQYDEWKSSGSRYLGWSERNSTEFRWESHATPSNGAQITATKEPDGQSWKVAFTGSVLPDTNRESSLVFSFFEVHFHRLVFQINRPEILAETTRHLGDRLW